MALILKETHTPVLLELSNYMKSTLQNLTRKLLLRLDKALDMPKYRAKNENVFARPRGSHHVIICHVDRANSRETVIEMTRETYYKIRDQLKSFDKKNENNRDEITTQ